MLNSEDTQRSSFSLSSIHLQITQWLPQVLTRQSVSGIFLNKNALSLSKILRAQQMDLNGLMMVLFLVLLPRTRTLLSSIQEKIPAVPWYRPTKAHAHRSLHGWAIHNIFSHVVSPNSQRENMPYGMWETSMLLWLRRDLTTIAECLSSTLMKITRSFMSLERVRVLFLSSNTLLKAQTLLTTLDLSREKNHKKVSHSCQRRLLT